MNSPTLAAATECLASAPGIRAPEAESIITNRLTMPAAPIGGQEGNRRSQADADKGRCTGRQGLDRRGHIIRHRGNSVVAVRPPVGVTMAREVDGDERAGQGKGHRVPRVSVLCSAVQEDGVRRLLTPKPGH